MSDLQKLSKDELLKEYNQIIEYLNNHSLHYDNRPNHFCEDFGCSDVKVLLEIIDRLRLKEIDMKPTLIDSIQSTIANTGKSPPGENHEDNEESRKTP